MKDQTKTDSSTLSVVPAAYAEMIDDSEVPSLLDEVRPAWQSRGLIERVKRLLRVDPSSACQRIFNAAIHDLKEKVVLAGLDIAGDTAKAHRLPTIQKQEDVEDYSVSHLIDLVHRMGLLTYAQWRKLCRVYDIRRDLEHEDDSYEAGIEDCIYIFKTCVEVVLAKDPVELLRVTDIKTIVEKASPAAITTTTKTDYEHAPQPRQEEILKFLVSVALDASKPEIVRQNALAVLSQLSPVTQNPTKLAMTNYFQEKYVGKNSLTYEQVRVALAAGLFPYLRDSQRVDFFEAVLARLDATGHHWKKNKKHGDLLRRLKEIGGLAHCPKEVRPRIIEWLVLAYVGEPGGYGYGRYRKVFYSNSAAPLVRDIVKGSAKLIRDDLKHVVEWRSVKLATEDADVARRLEQIVDLVEGA